MRYLMASPLELVRVEISGPNELTVKTAYLPRSFRYQPYR